MIEVLIPYYGDPELLRIAVESVLRQDDPEWSLVVVDNHYPDPAPGRWVRSLDDPRVRYVRNERNVGVSGNLRRCLEIATASHFVIMGADDVLHPNYVSAVRRAVATHPGATMFQPRVVVIDEHGRPTRPLADRIKERLAPPADQPHALGGEELATSLLRGNWAYFPAITWSRAAVGDRTFRPDMETVFDLDFLMDAIIDGATFVLLAEQAFSYRRHLSSVSSQTARDTARFEEESRFFAELAPRLRDLGWASAARAARLHPTSRLHALALLPGALRMRNTYVVRQLWRHATELT